MEKDKKNQGYEKGSNFAPLKPILDLKDSAIPEKQVTDHYLVKELRKKYEEKIGENKSAWREMICAGQIIAHFIQGEQILRINTFNGQPRIEKSNKNDPLHIKAINKMRFYSTVWQDKWRSSKPDILLSPLSNNDEAIAQVRKANVVVDYLERQFFSDWFDLHEGLNAQIWGWYGREVKPDFSKKQYSVIREILGEKEYPIGKATGQCDCGYRGSDSKEKKFGAKTFHACPKCDSLEYDFQPAATQMMPYVKGKEKVFLPEIVCKPIEFPAVRFDLSCRAEESPYFIKEKRVEPYVLRRMLGNIRFPEGESGNDFGLDVIDDLAKRGTTLGGGESGSTEKKHDRITLTEMYLTVDELYDIKIGGEEKTVEGTTLPKGKRMSDIFPNGACIVGINGLSLITGIYHGDHREVITSGVYHMKPSSGAGQGVGDAVEIQKQFNRRYSQIDNFMAKRATPPIMTPEGAIEPRYLRQLSNPGAVIPIKIQNFPEIKDVRQLMAALQGESVPGDLIDTTFNRLETMLQTAYHTTTFGGANAQGVKQNTATYWEQNNANSDAIFSPALVIKADVTTSTIKKGFYKWVKCTPEARFIPYKSPQSNNAGMDIKGSDVDAEYNWSYVPGSEAPKNRFTESQKRMMFFSQFQGGITGWVQARQTFPKELAEIERDFDVNFEVENFDSIGETCRLRFNRAKKQLGKMDNLSILANLEPSLLITEPSLQQKAAWFQSLLDTEEGLAMTVEERELVSAFILTFRELAKGVAVKDQIDAAEVQLAGQQVMVDAQQQQQAAQQEQQAALQQEQNSQQMVAQGLAAVADGVSREQEMAHEREMGEDEDAMEATAMIHEMGQNEVQRQADLELAKRSQAK